jgi:poly-beta-1,6-N-acetyl-D-glucosamine N-deacetylase
VKSHSIQPEMERLVRFKAVPPIQIKRKKTLFFLLKILSVSFALILITSILSYITAPKVPILGFHGIHDVNQPNVGMIQNPIAQRMSYPMQDIETILDYLLSHNYWFLSAQDLHDFFVTENQAIPPEHIGQKPIMLSFDDSYKTIYTNLLPVLEKLEARHGKKATATLFINPGTLSKPGHPSTTYLSCEDLRAGFTKGFYDIQSHGLTHKNLTQISPAVLDTELAQAQTQLRGCMTGLAAEGAIASHIAYPYGASNPQVEAIASKYYSSGFLYNSKILRFCWLKNRYAISRFTVNREKSAERLIQMAERSTPLTHKQPC